MKILLVNSNRMRPPIAPIGLDYIADSMVSAGHRIELLDLCWAADVPAAISKALADFQPDTIGMTLRNIDDSYFSGQVFFLPELRKIVQQIRAESDVPLVLGGVGFSVLPEAVMDFCGADFGIAGEGEVAWRRFLDALSQQADFAQVPGLLYRQNGVLRRNPSSAVDLTTLPLRRRTLVDNARYFREGGQAGFETKRGCAMSCIYCVDPIAKGRHVRLMPPKRVAAEIATLYAQGIDHFHTCDSEFNLPRHHAIEVCQAIIEAGLGDKIRWYAYCSPAPFDEEMATLFKRAGCAGINFGADNGSDEMLRRLGRHFASADISRAAALCKRHGIAVMFDLLLGGPGETLESCRQSIELIRSLAPDCSGLSVGVRLCAGTHLADQILSLPPAQRLGLHGATRDNDLGLQPLFYIEPALGPDILHHIRDLVAGDPRFFFSDSTPDQASYNYNDNQDLVDAIRAGARGAFWDILRKKSAGIGV